MVQQLVSQQALLLKKEYGHLEKDMNIDIYDHPQRAPTVMTVESQTKLLTLLSTLPHGVIKWSHAVPGATPEAPVGVSPGRRLHALPAL